MRDSIFYSALRSLVITFFVIVGLGLGILAVSLLIGAFSPNTADSKLKTVNSQEIMPNAEGKRETLSSDAPVILQINIDGIIGTEELSMQTVRQQLIESREGDFKNDRVKAILVHINTPGGTVVDADGIYRALKEYKEKYKTPIYAYVDGLCASGGMYVASATDKIFASDVSLIGSVGVVAPTFVNVTKMMDKIGVEALTLIAGKDKDAMNPFRPWKPGEEKNYQSLIDYYYRHFVNIVTSSRSEINRDKLVKDYGARVFPAQEAQELGFIDASGISLGDTIKRLLKEVGIEGEYYQIVKLERKDWWTTLFSSDSALFTGKVKHQLQLPAEFDMALHNQFLYLYTP